MTQEFGCPELPEWAQNIEPESYGELTENVSDQLALFLSAKNGNRSAASEIAARYENGRMIDSPKISEAIKWHIYAAGLGDAYSALRAAQLRLFIPGYKTEIIVIEMAILAITNVLSWVTKESLCIAMSAAELLLERKCDLKTYEIINELLQEPNVQNHPTFEKISLRYRQIVEAKQAHKPSLQIALNKITGDSDFKPGIYKVLESPLPLIETPKDLNSIKSTLDAEFPWFSEVNEIIHRQLVCLHFSPITSFKLRPLLLAGPPGVGKTLFAKRLAELCGVPFRMIMAAGNADSMSLRGLSRGWGSARPGVVLQTIATEGVANPLFMIDELDKSSPSSHNGRMWDVLLQLIEPETAKIYLDECLQVPCNLSKVSWIATANEIGSLPKPLIDRFTVISINAPEKEHYGGLIQSVVTNFAKELDVDYRMLPSLTRDELDILYRCKNPREINRTFRILIEKKLVLLQSNASIN